MERLRDHLRHRRHPGRNEHPLRPHRRDRPDQPGHVADELNRTIGNETTAVVLDTSAVTYLDSTALRFLFALAERLERLQVTFAIVAPPDSIGRKVMDLAGLNQVADVRDD